MVCWLKMVSLYARFNEVITMSLLLFVINKYVNMSVSNK